MTEFGVRVDELTALFERQAINSGVAVQRIEDLEGAEGLAVRLQSSLTSGLSTKDPPLSLRIESFGDNYPQVYKAKSLLHFVWLNLNEVMHLVLLGAAIISLAAGLLHDLERGWLEGVAICLVVVVNVSVLSTNDYNKEKQFIALNEEIDSNPVVVKRDAVQQQILAKELLAGDLLFVKSGDVVAADGVLVSGNGLSMDESSITGESAVIKKHPAVDPFLIADSRVLDGNGHVLVCCVGANCTTRSTQEILHVEDDVETPLTQRLSFIATVLGKLGVFSGLLIAMALIGHVGVTALADAEWGSEQWGGVVEGFIIGVTILVVALPEGMPLSFTLSMAYAIVRMKEYNIFVKHLKGCEIMGAATTILTDKTGTLTQNKMTVSRAILFGRQGERFMPYLSDREKQLVGEIIIRNTTAFFSESTIVGDPTEAALIMLINNWGLYNEKIRATENQIAQFAFSSESKRMTTVYRTENGYTVYTKGSALIVLDLCGRFMADEQILEFTPTSRQEYKEHFKTLANDGLRVIALAFNTLPTYACQSSQTTTEEQLIFIGFLGIEDPLRPESAKAVGKCHRAGVVVRLFTGDSKEIATKIATECGILPRGLTACELADCVMEGAEFRRRVGELKELRDERSQITSFELEDLTRFAEVVSRLRVVAVCSPKDKVLLTVGLKKLDEVVAVSGDGSNDAAALKQSDIGLSMMSGTQLSKESADIILLDDNIENLVECIKWGRNVYANIRRFLQFQFTVNFVALLLCTTGALTVGASPLTAIQMLWVNLIMDSMAALALATEPPTDSLFDTKPFGRTENIVTVDMVVFVITQSGYQLVILLTILYVAPYVLEIDPGWEADDKDPRLHFTLIFNTFVMLQLFNEIVCRKIYLSEYNVFKGIFSNWVYICILLSTFGAQLVILEYGGDTFRTNGLSWEYQLFGIAIGAVGIIYALLVKFLANSWLKHRTRSKEEEFLLK